MQKQLLHTPDGVRDIYNGECQRKLLLQERLHHILLSYGYHDIQTPTFEFFNIFSSEIGTTPSKDLYKFFDKDGNTLVLRPDFTPSIARSAAKYYMDEEMPVKLCYMGNTFINSNSYQGRLKETTQCGAELIGDSTIFADAEILAMAVESLKTAGLTDFQISIGHTQFFTGLMNAASLSEEDEIQIRDLIANKNFFGVEEFVEELSISSELKSLFSMLGIFDLKMEDLTTAKEYAKNYPIIYQALEELERLDTITKAYEIDRYLSFELGIISSYHYYTGIIFAGYTFGSGEPIIKGGRYDKLLNYFGKNAPSIGFAIVVDQLLAALTRQKIDLQMDNLSQLIVYNESTYQKAIRKAIELRKEGQNVELLCFDTTKTIEDYKEYAKAHSIVELTFINETMER